MAQTKKADTKASANTNLLAKLKASSIVNDTSILMDSDTYSKNLTLVDTGVPMLNVALSGKLDGGFASGLTVFAGESKRFKTLFVLLCAAAYLRKYPDAVLLFYDSEFGTPQAYFESLHIDPARVLHTPVTTVEELRSDIANQLKTISKGDHVFIMIDSIGNLASAKEVNDAVDNKSSADMTRARQIKSLLRIITPQLTLKDVPCFVVAHTYATMEMYSKEIVSGGRGVMFSADSVFIIGRHTDKDDSGVAGYHFIINVEKSRFVKEKSKVAIGVSFAGGVEKNSGLLETAVELGFVNKLPGGWYTFKGDDVKHRATEFMDDTLASVLHKAPAFRLAIENRFKVAYNALFNSAEVE